MASQFASKSDFKACKLDATRRTKKAKTRAAHLHSTQKRTCKHDKQLQIAEGQNASNNRHQQDTEKNSRFQ